jgi:hypothetical protein
MLAEVRREGGEISRHSARVSFPDGSEFTTSLWYGEEGSWFHASAWDLVGSDWVPVAGCACL